MPKASQGLQNVGRDAIFRLEDTRATFPVAEAMAPEAPVVVQRVEPWRFDRRLGTHIEDGDVEKDLKGLLVLTVPARTTQRQERLPVAQDDRRCEGCPRSLAALNEVGMAVLIQHERLHPVAERNPSVPGDEDAAKEPA